MEFRQVSDQILDCNKNLLIVLGNEVSVNIAHVGLEFWCVFEAFLHVCLIVMIRKSIHEASNEVCNLDSGQLVSTGAWQLVSFQVFSWYWKGDLAICGCHQSGVIPITVIVVVSQLFSICCDRVPVAYNVMVTFDVCPWALADPISSPALSNLNISLVSSWAAGQVADDLRCVFQEKLDSLK